MNKQKHPPTPTIEEQVAELLDKMANGTVSRLKAKYQFNHSGRQALEMFADDIKANVKVRNKLSLLITKARIDELNRMQYTDAEQGLAEDFAWMAYLSDRIAQLKATTQEDNK